MPTRRAFASPSRLPPRCCRASPGPRPCPRARNVVLVHGLFADGSCWSEVIVRLQAAGLAPTAVQNPLTTLAGGGGGSPAGAGAAGRADRARRAFLRRHDRDRSRRRPESLGAGLCRGAGPDAGEDYTALAKTVPDPTGCGGHRLRRRRGPPDRGRPSCAISRATCPRRRRSCSMRSRSRSTKRCSTGRTPRPPGARSRASMRSRRRTGRSTPICSGSWPSAWAP